MRGFFTPMNIGYLVSVCLIANGYVWLERYPALWFAVIPLFLAINVMAGASGKLSRRLRICRHGAVLLGVFVVSLSVSLVYHAGLALSMLPEDPWPVLWSVLMCAAAEFVLFWNGMLCIYFTSYQLGVKWRVIGALCGMIPIVNLIVLGRMLGIVMDEVAFETEKERVDLARRDARICGTRYPILLVHGVFFRDSKRFNYWGRIPTALENNGAIVYYGEHPSAQSVADSAAALSERICDIARAHGGKVNVIAHSKGGLDCRYAISELDAAPYVASLTTVNTPHRGCRFADYLLSKAPESVKQSVADAYNGALAKLGDEDPDFLAAVGDLTAEACERLNAKLKEPSGLLCQSVGSVLRTPRSGRFPLNLSYHLAHHFEGPNDGLVSECSFPWGGRYELVTVAQGRGVSHGDMIDLGRENLRDFDVREFYVKLVSDLKKRGL